MNNSGWPSEQQAAPKAEQRPWGKPVPSPASQAPSSEPATALTFESAKGWQAETPKLETAQDVKSELGVLYALSKRGVVDVGDASKLANMLAIISRIIATSELEQRIEALEAQRGPK